ncbi:helix-turn-helix domain-containing protein [Streptomyces sp. NPDC050121]|uniref:helix-turn-helix domain-containing protein n=1 Tax=Streptomyces sp. NPDC050121 TaxID=3365601 RepID=UPI0037B01AAF
MNSTQSPVDTPSEYLSLRQVAAELKCSVRTVRRYLANGRLGYSQEIKGGVIRVSRADLAAYYQASRRGPAVSRRRTAAA